MTKVIIAGGRNFTDWKTLYGVCDEVLNGLECVEIVSGNCPTGADFLGEQYAMDCGYSLKKFPADWKRFGRSAGPKRNAEMATYADMLIAFWDGTSRGTWNMIQEARKEKLVMIVLNCY